MLALTAWTTSSAVAQSIIRSAPAEHELIESYVAHIGRRDLMNSNGARLNEPWQILRQDRANFHRFGIQDADDEWDSFFGNTNNRAAFENMLRNGSISPQAARDIVRGGATVLVEIYGSGNVGRSVVVTVAR